MTEKIIDLEEMRRRRATPPSRAPDFTLQGWLERGAVEWVYFEGAELDRLLASDNPHFHRTAALLDAVWLNDQQSPSATERPHECMAFLGYFSQGGGGARLWPRGLCMGTNWRHGWWVLRQGRHIVWSLLRIAWYATRGRLPEPPKP